MKKKILIVDDHPLMRVGIKMLLSQNQSYEIIEASGGAEAMDCLNKTEINLAILDIDMPEINGVEVGHYIEKNYPETKLIFLTSHADFNTFAEASEINYSGFLFKENALELLLECVVKVFNNEKYTSPECAKLTNNNKERLELLQHHRKRIESLTQTERRILLLISEGKSTPRIAEELFNSPKTIENHRTNICQKMELKGANNLLSFALEYRDLLQKIIGS
jgi:Response regulator containing a CheY-like receiver domain and an HTH DNA-binding domain